MAEVRLRRRMSPSDSILWKIERDPVLRSTVTAVALLDRSPDFDTLRTRMAGAARTMPWLREVMVAPAVGVDSPRWRPADHFDLDYHLRRIRPPGPGSVDEVLRIAEREAMTSFDPTRPPWEFVLLDDVGTGAALICKFHHAASDGIAAMRLALELVDRDPVPPDPSDDKASPVGAGGSWPGIDTARRLARAPLDAAALAVRVGRSPGRSLRTGLDALVWGARLLAPTGSPRSPIMHGRSTRLRFSAFDVDFGELRASARRTGATLNDVFVAGVADGLRRYHESSGARVEELRMTLPISVRRPGDPSAGNRFVPVRFALALSADPRQLVATVSRTVREWRDGPALAMTDTMASVLSALPAPLVARVFGSLLRNVDFVATNVPGPSVPMAIAGARIVGLYAFAPPSGAALNVSLVTNAQRCCIGVNMDPEAIGDPDLMTASLHKGLHKMLALGRQGERTKPVRAGAGR